MHYHFEKILIYLFVCIYNTMINHAQMVNCNINMAKGLEFFNFFEPSPKKDHTAHTEYVDEGNGNGHNDKYIAIPDKWSRWDMVCVSSYVEYCSDIFETYLYSDFCIFVSD